MLRMSAVRQRAAHESDIQHAGKAKIRNKFAATAHKTVVFLAENARADTLLGHLNLLRSDNVPRRPRDRRCGRAVRHKVVL